MLSEMKIQQNPKKYRTQEKHQGVWGSSVQCYAVSQIHDFAVITITLELLPPFSESHQMLLFFIFFNCFSLVRSPFMEAQSSQRESQLGSTRSSPRTRTRPQWLPFRWSFFIGWVWFHCSFYYRPSHQVPSLPRRLLPLAPPQLSYWPLPPSISTCPARKTYTGSFDLSPTTCLF